MTVPLHAPTLCKRHHAVKNPLRDRRGPEGTIEDRFCDSYNTKGSRRMDAYLRFSALVAAIVRMVLRRDLERIKISSFLTGARKNICRFTGETADRQMSELRGRMEKRTFR